MNHKHTLTIGGLARAAGVNIETIRYYQRVGMLAKPDKPVQGARRYSENDLKRIHFIKRAQALGFTLSEVADLLALSGASACRETRAVAQIKLQSIEARIRDLQKMQTTLLQLVTRCNESDDSTGCPIIEALVNIE
ncbi:Hg(II)-responsive transcriptional regulator [Limnobacter sp.]|uniref:Hg(II)-responsive transcriptional regulator n=1 Tax=Limnobacter sp. TaxID=2003368 RepID=UPI00258DAEDE|nr:Hg(II)-responsive transcriptional regulator [Limnobacter sp.]HEX5484503.1 Hg(II)-responsive transcriptional regulator [Limnobacter sp.]